MTKLNSRYYDSKGKKYGKNKRKQIKVRATQHGSEKIR
jgi:hypothetical protein